MKRKFLFPVLLGLVLYHVQACDNSPIDPRLLDALQQNGAANAMYAKFLSEANSKTPFDEYFRVYDSIRKTKHEINEHLQAIDPSTRYYMLHQLLVVSVQSDEKLMSLEMESLQQVLASLEVMRKINDLLASGIENPSLPPEENQRRKLWAIQEAQRVNRDFRDRLSQTSAALENAKATSKEAVDLLNKEIDNLSLPNKQQNPFAIESAKPSPTQ